MSPYQLRRRKRLARRFSVGDQQWPYYALFLNRVDDSIKLLASCLVGCWFPANGAVEIDPERLRDFLIRGFAAMNAIFDDHGFPETELEAMSDGILEVIEYAGLT